MPPAGRAVQRHQAVFVHRTCVRSCLPIIHIVIVVTAVVIILITIIIAIVIGIFLWVGDGGESVIKPAR